MDPSKKGRMMSDKNKEFNPVKQNESLPVLEWEDFDRIGEEKDRCIKKQGRGWVLWHSRVKSKTKFWL